MSNRQNPSLCLRRRVLASLCAFSFGAGAVVASPVAPTASAVPANQPQSQYVGTPRTTYRNSTLNTQTPGSCAVGATLILDRQGEGGSLDYVQVPGFGRLYADEIDADKIGGDPFEMNLVAQLGHDTGKGDQFPRYRETARVSANILNGKPLLRIKQRETRRVVQGGGIDTVVVSDQGTADIEVNNQQTVDFSGNQNTVIGWGLTQNDYPGVPYSDAFVGVTAQISGSFAPFPDENASCAPMTSTSTPVTMLADGQPHPFTINLDGVRTEDYGRLRVIVVDKDGNPIDGANVEKGAAIPGAGDNITGMHTKVTLPKDDPRFHEGKGAFLQVYAVPREGDSTRAAAGPNKRAEL